MRILHGAFSAAINPLSYSLIADYFPPEKRSRANAILTTGNYLGIALSSITILLIRVYGWRSSYFLMGIFGVLGGGLSFVLMKNPEKIRKSFTAIPKNSCEGVKCPVEDDFKTKT